MLDFSLVELLLIIAVAVLVIGPNEIPAVMRALGRVVRRLQYLRFALSQQFEDFMRENDLHDLKDHAAQSAYNETDSEKSADEEQDNP